jgi:hypothetical protein
MSDDDAMLRLQGLVPGLATCLRQREHEAAPRDIEEAIAHEEFTQAVASAEEQRQDADILLEEMFDIGFSEEETCLAIARVSAAIVEMLASEQDRNAVQLLGEFSLSHAEHTPPTETGKGEDH